MAYKCILFGLWNRGKSTNGQPLYTLQYLTWQEQNMVYKSLILLLALLAVSQTQVVVLDDSNYTSFVQQHPFVFVKFYAPWCGHCKSMAKDYIQLAQASAGKEYVIAEVDATVAENVSSELGVQGYPSIKFIVSGSVIDYEGERTAPSMQNWIEKLIKAEIKQITEDDLKSLIGTENLVVVQGASKEQLRSLAFAQQISNIPFYAVEGGDHKVTVYLKNSKTIEYTGEVSIKDISDWVTQQTLGHLVALSGQNVVKQIFENEARLPAFLLLKNPDFTEEALENLRVFCESQEKELKCAYADQTHQIYKGIARFFKAENNQESILGFFDYGIKNGYKFNNPNQLSQQTLAQFLQDISEGKIDKFYDQASSKEQKQIKYTNVVKLTNQTYQETLQNNKYVFVEYYSSTCGHCIQFAPEYEQLATKLKAEDSEFVIAAVDLTEQQEIKEQVNVGGFPTFRFYVKGQELEYNGPRDGDSMISYMSLVIKSQLKTVNSLEDLQKPAIAVYGIDEDSPFHLLSFVYTRFPIYQVLGESEFKVEIHEKKFAAYSGEKDLKAVGNWLEENTEPIIVNVVEEHPAKKLSKALEDQTPLLVIINRDNSESFKAAFTFLQTFCESQTEYICGIANKGDAQYDNFNDWIGDSSQSSALLYLNTQKFEKYVYQGDLAALTTEGVNQFVADVKAGKLQAFQGQAGSEGEAAEEATDGETPEGQPTEEDNTEGQTSESDVTVGETEQTVAEAGEQNGSQSAPKTTQSADQLLVQVAKIIVKEQDEEL